MNLGSEDAARMRHNRAIKKLITRIGGFRPWLDKDSSDKVSENPDEIVETDKTEDKDERNEDSEDYSE
jgi:hypothetical protein